MKISHRNVFDKQRRDFLQLLARAGVSKSLFKASPLVAGMMYSRLVEAQTQPNKSVVIYTPDGCIPNHWFPNNSLSSFPVQSQPYQAVANQCHFLSNMTHHRGGHGVMPTIINNSWGGDSFDVNMGRIIGANLPYRYINLGVHSNGHGYLTRESGTEVPFEDSPFNAFNRLFGAGGGGGGGGGESSGKGSIINAHKDALMALSNKLGDYEKHRLDAHLTAIEETEQRLVNIDNNPGVGSCDTPEAPAQIPLQHATFDEQAKLQADIIVLALQCNLTASASLALGNHQGEVTLPTSYGGIYHQSIHGGGGSAGNPYPSFDITRRYLSTLSVYLLQRLEATGLLDSTIVCNTTDMGHGDAHSSNDVPLVISGGGNRIRRGIANSGGGSPLDMIHTAAVALNAHQHPQYQGYGNLLTGVLA